MMNIRNRMAIAFLVLALPATAAVLTPQRPTAPVREMADWFPMSFEPIRQVEAPLKPVEERSTVSNQLSELEVPVPATVQNLRRADR